MYFPVSSTLIEFLILSMLEKHDSYGYEISQTIKLVTNARESSLSYFEKVGSGPLCHNL